MPRTLQFKRYPASVLANTTGAVGELIINSTNQTLTVHDGAVPGGYALLNSQTDNSVDQFARNTANTAANNITVIQSVNLTQNTNITNATNLAQASFNAANTKLNLTGGTITGNLVVSGKSTFSGVAEIFSGIADATGVVVHDCSTGRIFNHTSIDDNFTANFTNLNLNSGEATTLTLVLNQGGTAYIANSVQIGGVAQTIRWSANTVPTGNINAVDVQSFSVLNSSGTYTVLGQLSTFG